MTEIRRFEYTTEMVRGRSVRNVNEAYALLVEDLKVATPDIWPKFVSRGLSTYEINGTFITEYRCPNERVLFDPVRDANPFFHFFEALWILDGRSDVETLATFNSQIAQYSDDGVTFNAPYGYRLRYAFGINQIEKVIMMLRDKPDTRQAVMIIWDPAVDLRVNSKDYPCNDMIAFKIREDRLRMTVMCRSNDALLGAYGANAVQFSMLQEFVARAVGVGLGTYIQISDSFHVYAGSVVYERVINSPIMQDYSYEHTEVKPYPLMHGNDWAGWLRSLRYFLMARTSGASDDPFFLEVAQPLYDAWVTWRAIDLIPDKNKRIEKAVNVLQNCAATDWRRAAANWLLRRIEG